MSLYLIKTKTPFSHYSSTTFPCSSQPVSQGRLSFMHFNYQKWEPASPPEVL
uniref:Macaca fascicularis brain cDNA, clone: QflA-20378 n=1 Tax=Macaca fascicularis TaxID=9541 RepID=I7GM12_MACFA|nr:unnamed protein product [Macaca fascicularis]